MLHSLAQKHLHLPNSLSLWLKSAAVQTPKSTRLNSGSRSSSCIKEKYWTEFYLCLLLRDIYSPTSIKNLRTNAAFLSFQSRHLINRMEYASYLWTFSAQSYNCAQILEFASTTLDVSFYFLWQKPFVKLFVVWRILSLCFFVIHPHTAIHSGETWQRKIRPNYCLTCLFFPSLLGKAILSV